MDITKIGMLIYVVRGQRVMMDRDLAALYGVQTGALNRAVGRNRERFPEEFMFQLNSVEWENLKCQIGISRWGGDRAIPHAFTEHGVAMLSSVLRSKRAIRLKAHDEALGEHAGAIREVFEDIRRLMEPPEGPKRKIGF